MNSIHFFWNRRSQSPLPVLLRTAVSTLLLAVLCLAPHARAQEPQEQSPEPTPVARLTLKGAVNAALHSSREVALARLQVSVAERAAAVTRSRFFPNLYTGSGAAYFHGIPATPGGAPPSLFSMNYSQTVFNSPVRGELRAADTRAEIQRLEADRVRENVIVAVASAYLELGNVRHALNLLRQERSSATRIMELTRDRVAADLELPVELTRAELAAARIEQQNLRFEGREDMLESELRNLCALAPDRPIELEDQRDSVPTSTADRPVHELVDLGLTSSIELKQAELEYRARQERLRGERGGYWPTLDIVGQYSVLSRKYAKFYTTFQRNEIQIGVQLNIPIFSAHTGAAIGLAREDLSFAELQWRSRRSQVQTDVRREARQTRELEAGREVARLELKLAQEDLRVVQARFDEGRAGLRDIENLRLEEATRWLAFLEADFEYQKARLDLLRQTGQLASLYQ